MTSEKMKPTTIWWFDVNLRVYEKPKPGNIWGSGGPIWREHWRECRIVSETSRSWVTDHRHKIPKTGPLPHGFAWSSTEIDELAWLEDNKYPLSDAVRSCRNPMQLKQVAALIGYESKTRER